VRSRVSISRGGEEHCTTSITRGFRMRKRTRERESVFRLQEGKNGVSVPWSKAPPALRREEEPLTRKDDIPTKQIKKVGRSACRGIEGEERRRSAPQKGRGRPAFHLLNEKGREDAILKAQGRRGASLAAIRESYNSVPRRRKDAAVHLNYEEDSDSFSKEPAFPRRKKAPS